MANNGAGEMPRLRVVRPRLVARVWREVAMELEKSVGILHALQGEVLGLATVSFARCDYDRAMAWSAVLGSLSVAIDGVRMALEQGEKAGSEVIGAGEAE